MRIKLVFRFPAPLLARLDSLRNLDELWTHLDFPEDRVGFLSEFVDILLGFHTLRKGFERVLNLPVECLLCLLGVLGACFELLAAARSTRAHHMAECS